jgi:hypothetical protein
VRCLALTLAAASTLAFAAGAARADDDDDDPDGDFTKLPVKSIAVGIQGHGTRVKGQSEGGVGATLELAYGRGRWQYLAEGSIASSSRDTGMMTGTTADAIAGHLWRGALGGRWLARQFVPDSSFGVELFLLGEAGMEHYHYDGGSKLTRPELAFGFGIQGRGFRAPRFGFRLDARLLFTPSGSNSAPGFLTGLAFPW